MTSLNLAYGDEYDEMPINKPQQQQPQQYQQSQQPQQQAQQQAQQQQAQIIPSQQQLLFQQQNDVLYQQNKGNGGGGGGQRETKQMGYSFWDRMVYTKIDVIKLAVFSLVIVLGISIDRLLTHYITSYISTGDLSYNQELLLRLCYPVSIFLFLWIIKSL